MNNGIKLNRFDVVWIDLPKVLENPHLQHGKHPCVIISNDTSNKYSPMVTVLSITTSYRNLPTRYKFTKEELKHIGLKRDSYVIGESILPVDKRCVMSKIGSMEYETQRKVIRAALTQIGEEKQLLVASC